MPSFHTFFTFTQGLKSAVMVPHGTIRSCQRHVTEVERVLGFRKTRYKKNPAHWDKRVRVDVTDEVFCETATNHNRWVVHFYEDLAKWSADKPSGEVEKLTNRIAQTFWHGLEPIVVPVQRWTNDYYRDRMEHVYDVMRGREDEGASLGTEPLTTRQAAGVVILFAEFLDRGDIRLDVPNGYDDLRASYDGGYDWCETCGPMVWEDVGDCRKRRCPLRAEWREQNRD
jgi:hypothetical protein